MTDAAMLDMKIVRTVWDAFDAGVRAARCAKELGDLSASCSVATTDALKQWADTLNETDQEPERLNNPERAAIPDVVEVQWDVRAWKWFARDEIPPGWEPFAYDRGEGAIICKRRKS